MAIEDVYKRLEEIEGGEELSEMIGGEVALLSDGAAAKIQELEAALAEAKRELVEVKSRNFDLITAATAAAEDPEPEPEPEVLSVEDLFE